jgi:glycosyltransferase involved in cell wall biosynthesis
MKICTLTHTYPRFINDINAPFVEKLMEDISGKGNDVSVLTAYDPEWSRDETDHTVDLRTYKYIKPDKMHILGYSRTIEGNVRFRKRVMLLSPLLFLASYRAFLKLVREKEPDVIHAHWILPNGFIAGHVSRVTGIPLLIQTHGSDIFTSEKNPLFRFMARYAAKYAKYIVSPSPDHVTRLGALGIDTKKIGIVPNTVEADFSTSVTEADTDGLRQKLGIPAGNKIVLAMGRMVYVKGFNYLLEGFKKIAGEHPNITLVLAGDGVIYDEIRGQADALGIGDRVIMPGAVMRGDVPVYFKMADMFVVPSIRHESGAVDGLPVVVPEAMAAGLPVISSDVGGIPILIRDGYNGILIPERDTGAIADSIQKLLADETLRTQYGKRSRAIIENGANYDTISDYFVRLYSDIAAQNKQPCDITGFSIDIDQI